jgi:sporulation related protein
MATQNRTPDDLQEAVAATLRRLRGEVHNQGPAAAVERTEPQFSSPVKDEAPPAPAGEERMVEPDLLTGSEPEIPPTPATRSALRESQIAYRQELAKGRLRLLPYVLSLMAILVFAGIVWWAYHAIVGAPKNGQVPVIAADQAPAKVPPADQGATDGSGQQKTVYDQISGTNTQPKTEVLLPGPETPQAPPPAAPAPTTNDTTTTPSVTETTTTPLPTAPAPAATGTTVGTTTTQRTTTTTADTGSSTAGATTPSDLDLSGVPTLAPALPVPETTTADNSGSATGATAGASTSTTQTASIADNFHIQLAALRSEADAKRSWDQILAKHNDVLGPLTVHIVRADLGSQGIYYRLQAGPFADKASAKAACDKLKSAGQQCLVKP